MPLRHVMGDLFPDRALAGGQLERQPGVEGLQQSAGPGGRGGGGLGLAAAALGED